MIQSKAIDILRELKRKEFLLFGKHLESSAFTANKSLVKLYNYLKKEYPAFSSEKITKNSIYASVYGNTLYNDAKARKLLSDLYKEAEKFIVILNALQKRNYDKIILEELETRKLDSLFISKYEEMNAYLDKDEKHYQYFLEKFLLEWKNIMFHLERGLQHKIALNVYKRAEYLIFFFLSDLFLTLSDIDANKNAYNIQSNINLAEAFIQSLDDKKLFAYIDKNNFDNKDLVYSYYLGYLAIRNFDDEKYYRNLKDYVINNIDNFNEWSQRTSVIFLVNYCKRKLRRMNSEKFRLELNENYRLFLKYKLFKISGENYIRVDVFINILTNFFDVGKTEEVALFLEENIESIQPSHRKNMLAVANALIQFEKGNFRESLKNVTLIKTNTFLYKNYVKVLSLKNNYELKNYDIAMELSVNYRNFLNENKHVTEVGRIHGTEFLNYYNTLWKALEGKTGKLNLKALKEEIEMNQGFTESAWILEKVNEIKLK